MVGSGTDPTAALCQAPATGRLAQVVEMRTDVRRAALWQAPVQRGGSVQRPTLLRRFGKRRLPGELRSPHLHHNHPNFNHLRSTHNSLLAT